MGHSAPSDSHFRLAQGHRNLNDAREISMAPGHVSPPKLTVMGSVKCGCYASVRARGAASRATRTAVTKAFQSERKRISQEPRAFSQLACDIFHTPNSILNITQHLSSWFFLIFQ